MFKKDDKFDLKTVTYNPKEFRTQEKKEKGRPLIIVAIVIVTILAVAWDNFGLKDYVMSLNLTNPKSESQKK